MVKKTKNIPTNQGDFFHQLENESPLENLSYRDLDLGNELRGVISGCIRRARELGLSRQRIVDEMNALMPDIDKPLTIRQLNSWTASSTEYKEFPLRYIAAFCAVTQDTSPLRLITNSINYELIDARGLAAVELGRTVAEKSLLTHRERELKAKLNGREK